MIATKATLTEAIHATLGKDSSKASAERKLDVVIQSIKLIVKRKKVLKLMGFGTFRVIHRKARNGVNPKTGEKMKIPASKTVRFTPSAAFKQSV